MLFLHSKAYTEDMQKYPIIEPSFQPSKIGVPNLVFQVTEATLGNTTQMVQTLQTETREYLQDHYKT
jgi:hypothetical protein